MVTYQGLSEMERFLILENVLSLKGGTCLGMAEQLEKVYLQLKELLSNLKYGSVTLIVQDGKVIQLEKNEKVRLK
jgi:hypothetical protein